MRRFENDLRVVVTDPKSLLCGRRGKVVRLRFCDIAGWVQMDEAPPAFLCPFPKDDQYGRGKNVLLHPKQCEAA